MRETSGFLRVTLKIRTMSAGKIRCEYPWNKDDSLSAKFATTNRMVKSEPIGLNLCMHQWNLSKFVLQFKLCNLAVWYLSTQSDFHLVWIEKRINYVPNDLKPLNIHSKVVSLNIKLSITIIHDEYGCANNTSKGICNTSNIETNAFGTSTLPVPTARWQLFMTFLRSEILFYLLPLVTICCP